MDCTYLLVVQVPVNGDQYSVPFISWMKIDYWLVEVFFDQSEALISFIVFENELSNCKITTWIVEY